MRGTVGTSTIVAVQLTDPIGAVAEPDAMPVVSVVTADGRPLTPTVSMPDPQLLRVVVPALAEVDLVTVTARWQVAGADVATVRQVPITGQPVLTPLDVQALDGLAAVPIARCAQAAEMAEGWIEAALGWRMVRRLAIDHVDLVQPGAASWRAARTWMTVEQVPQHVRWAVTATGDWPDVSTWYTVGGRVCWPEPLDAAAMSVGYEVGPPSDALPADLVRATAVLARHVVLSATSTLPDRATSLATDIGTFQITVADERHPTGLPEVDAVIVRHRRAEVGFA